MPPHFLNTMIELKDLGPPHLETVVGDKQGHGHTNKASFVLVTFCGDHKTVTKLK